MAVTQSIAAAAVARDDDEAVAENEDRVGASETDGACVWVLQAAAPPPQRGRGGGAMDGERMGRKWTESERVAA